MSETVIMLLAAVGGELLLVLLLLLSVAYFRDRAARRRDREAMQQLLDRVRQAQVRRGQAVEQFLSGGLGAAGAPLAQAKADLLRAELALLQRFAGIYSQRNAGAAAKFDGDLFAALASYHVLTAADPVDQGAATELSGDTAELESLRRDNARLADELKTAMQAMSRMLKEYSAMFAGGAPDLAAPVAASAGTASQVDADAPPRGAADAVAAVVEVSAQLAEDDPLAELTAQGQLARPPEADQGVAAEQHESGPESATRDAAPGGGAASGGEPVAQADAVNAGPDGQRSAHSEVEVEVFDEPHPDDDAPQGGADGGEQSAPDGQQLDDLFDAGDEPLKSNSGS